MINEQDKVLELFDTDLVFFKPEADNYIELFSIVSEELMRKSIVKEGFLESLIHREENHPTAIPSELVDFAIPHTSTEYVLENKICTIVLEKPIIFKNMMDKNLEVEVRIVFIILITTGHKHMKVLSKIVDLVRDKEYVNRLLNSTSRSNLQDVITEKNKLKIIKKNK